MTECIAETAEELEDTQQGRFLTFALEKEEFGIEINYVTEIIGMQPITPLPEMPFYIKGIINLRGKIIPLVDMRLKFKKNTTDYTDRTCIIVVDVNEISAGLIVDAVADVVAIEDENISPPPDFGTGIHNKYIHGIGKTNNAVKLLLDCEKLFSENEIELPMAN
jgi:purine-binding chemotaxis protein CheW